MPRTLEISRPLGRIGRRLLVALALTSAVVSVGSSIAEAGRRTQILLLFAQGALICVLLVESHTRRPAEAELSDAEQRYRTVADFTADLEYWIRPDGSFAYVSPSCLRLTGYDPLAFLQRPELMTELVVEEDRPGWDLHHRLAS